MLNLLRLKATDVEPEQMKWIPFLPVTKGGDKTLGWDDNSKGEAGAIKVLFHNFFLEHLMKEALFFSKESRAKSPIFDRLQKAHEELGLRGGAHLEVGWYLDKYCPDRLLIYDNRLRNLVSKRNIELIKPILDIADHVAEERKELIPMLWAVQRFDAKHGVRLNRHPKVASRTRELVEKEFGPVPDDAATSARCAEEDELVKLIWADRDGQQYSEGNVKTNAQEEMNEMLEGWHDDHQTEWRVESYLDRVTWVF